MSVFGASEQSTKTLHGNKTVLNHFLELYLFPVFRSRVGFGFQPMLGKMQAQAIDHHCSDLKIIAEIQEQSFFSEIIGTGILMFNRTTRYRENHYFISIPSLAVLPI